MSQNDDKLAAAKAAAAETAQKAAATAAEIGGKVSEAASGFFAKLRRTVHEVTEDGELSEADRLIKPFVEANGALTAATAGGMTGDAYQSVVARYNAAFDALRAYAAKISA